MLNLGLYLNPEKLKVLDFCNLILKSVNMWRLPITLSQKLLLMNMVWKPDTMVTHGYFM